jgi:hypothetical protein
LEKLRRVQKLERLKIMNLWARQTAKLGRTKSMTYEARGGMDFGQDLQKGVESLSVFKSGRVRNISINFLQSRMTARGEQH